MPDQFGGWDSNFLLDDQPTSPGVPVADLGGWDSNFLLDDYSQSSPSVPFAATPTGGQAGPLPGYAPPSVPFVNQPSRHDPLTEILQGRGGPDWQVAPMDPASTFQPRTDALTADGIPFPRHFWPGSEVYKSAAHERRRLQQNKDAAFPFSSEDWNYYGGSLREGAVYEPPRYDGSVPLARLMKPLANDTIRGIGRAREVTDEQILNGLMGGDAVDLAALGADEEFRQKLQVYRNYQGDADRRGNKESAKIAAERKKEIIGKAREIWNKALDKQEQFERLKQTWREELDKGEGLTEGVKDRATARIAGQALFDVGTMAGSVFYELTGRDATAEDLNLTKLAYDAVVDEYAGGSSVEAGARGVGSSLFQGLLFGRLGRAIAGTSVGSQVSAAVAFGKGSRDQAMASASMVPMTDKRRKSHAGNQAAIETGLTLGFGALTSAIGGQTLESILGGGQKIPPIRKAFKTLLGELPEELSITALSDFESKTAGVTPEDAPLIPQLLETTAATIATLGLVESSRRLVNFASKKFPSRQDAIDAGLDAFARTAPARQAMAERLRQAEDAMRAQVDRADSAAVNLFELAKQTIESQRSTATAAPPTQPEQAATLQQNQPAPQENPANPPSNVANPPATLQPPPANILDDLAARHPEVAEAFAGPTGTPEFASIREHTAVVLDRYQKSGASTGIPELDAVMPTIIALHDIGKPAAIAAGDKNRQHEMTLPVLEQVMRADGATDQQVAFAKALVDQDIIGQLVMGQIDPKTAESQLSDIASQLNIGRQQLHSAMLGLYNADAGSYSSLSHLFDDKGRLTNYDQRILEESIYGEVQSIPWTEDYKPHRGRPGDSPDNDGSDARAIYTHTSAYDFTRFDAEKDTGNNYAGPGAYFLPAGQQHIERVYKNRILRRMLRSFGLKDRAAVKAALDKGDVVQFAKWAHRVKTMAEMATSPELKQRLAAAADTLAVMRDNPGGKTLEFEFNPKNTLDLGFFGTGGRMLTSDQLAAIKKAAGGNIGVTDNVRRGWLVYRGLQRVHGYAGANKILQDAGFDSIGFVHGKSITSDSPHYPVMVALDFNAPVRVQSGSTDSSRSGLTDANQPTQAAAGIPIDASHASALRRLFFSGGNQNDLTRDLVYRRDSIIRKHNAQVQQSIRDLERAVKKSGQAITPEQLNDALADPALITQLPTDVAVEVTKIRDHIDMLSDQIQMLGGITPDMFITIEGNKGKYITRSFRKFDNPKAWRKFALNDKTIMDDFAAEVRQASPNATDQDIKSLAEELLRRDTLMPGAFVKSGSTTQNYVKILQQRTNLSPAIRQLYGENKNIFENYANTIGQMSSMVAHRGFVANLVQDGLAAGIFSQEGGQRMHPDHVQQVAHSAIPQLAGMKGILMEPELAQAIDDLYAMPGTTQAGRIFAAGSGLVKASKTIFAMPRALIRNLGGNIPITIANGNWRFLRDWSGPLGGVKDFGGAAYETLMHDLANQGDPAAKARIARLKELGIIESFRIEELKDAARAAGQGVNWFITGEGKYAKTVRAASRVYAAMDTISKIQNYDAELAVLKRAHPGAPLYSLEEKAARIVRATNPTYGEASKAAKWWSRHAPFGSFAMFSAEILRTTGNRNLQMIEELTSGNKVLVAQGLRRAIGQVIAMGILGAIGEWLEAAFGTVLNSDAMQALRDRLPPWQKNSNIVVTSLDANGNPTSYVDLGYNDPFGIITKTAHAAMTGSREDALKQLSEPFLSEDILAGTLVSLLRGRDENDRPIFSEGLSEGEQWKQRAAFVAKKVEPGVFASGRRLLAAYNGETTSSGVPLSFANEMASTFGGMRVETFDREVADYYRNRDFDDRVKQSQTALREVFLNKGTFNPDRARRIYEDAEATRRNTLAEWRDYVEGSMKLGEQNPYGKVVRDVGQQSAIVKQMYSKTFVPYRFQDADFAKMRQLPQGDERIKLFQELYRKSVGIDE